MSASVEPAYTDKTAQFIRPAELRAHRAGQAAAMSPLLYYAVPALGSYVMLSIFFLRRPCLLHTPWAPAFCARLVAHRGGKLDGRGKLGATVDSTEG